MNTNKQKEKGNMNRPTEFPDIELSDRFKNNCVTVFTEIKEKIENLERKKKKTTKQARKNEMENLELKNYQY